MDYVLVGKVLFCDSVPYFGYISKVTNCTKFEEVHILCALWNFAQSCRMQVGIDGGPCKDRYDY